MQEPGGIDIEEEVRQLEEKVEKQLRAIYAKLTPWQKTQVARHPDRPHALAYIDGLITEFTPLAGRPGVRRRRGGRRRARAVPRPAGGGAGHRARRGHREPGRA